MTKNIGKQIRAARLRCSMTQERLAEALNVTPQAVSKWENGLTYPDIMMLPELSAALGVTIDALFESSFDTHLKRIECMIESSRHLTREEFDYAERWLREGSLDMEQRGRCLTALAELYNSRAESYQERAAEIARQALELEPEKKDNHSALCMAAGGALWDWCVANHSALIDYYKGFVRKHPNYAPGYLWLLDNLIADGRMKEAEDVLEQMRKVRDSYHYLLYKGWIAEKTGKPELAQKYWDEMVAQDPENWYVWSTRADAYAKRADYAHAISDYQKAAELEPVPRCMDNYDSIAQLCLLSGDRAGAMEAYEQVVRILREDWQMPEDGTVQNYLQKICQLRNDL